jgi:hypothetical protein
MAGFEKASGAKSTFEAIRSELGEADWLRVMDSLDPDVRSAIEFPEAHTMLPTSITGQLLLTINVVVCLRDRVGTHRLLSAAGRRDADKMMEGILSIFARFVSAEQAFKRSGSLMSSVYKGVHAEAIPHADKPGGTLVIEGLGDQPFAAAFLGGWIERAVERFGARKVSVIERAWESGNIASDRLEFVLDWQE